MPRPSVRWRVDHQLDFDWFHGDGGVGSDPPSVFGTGAGGGEEGGGGDIPAPGLPPMGGSVWPPGAGGSLVRTALLLSTPPGRPVIGGGGRDMLRPESDDRPMFAETGESPGPRSDDVELPANPV